MAKFAQVGDYCMNEACRDYGKQQSQQQKKNIKKFGKTRAGRQRVHADVVRRRAEGGHEEKTVSSTHR